MQVNKKRGPTHFFSLRACFLRLCCRVGFCIALLRPSGPLLVFHFGEPLREIFHVSFQIKSTFIVSCMKLKKGCRGMEDCLGDFMFSKRTFWNSFLTDRREVSASRKVPIFRHSNVKMFPPVIFLLFCEYCLLIRNSHDLNAHYGQYGTVNKVYCWLILWPQKNNYYQ